MLDLKLIEMVLASNERSRDVAPKATKPEQVRKVRDRGFSYTHRHRGNWFRPEYEFDEIQIAHDVDSYLFRAIKKKVDRFFLAGYEFVSMNEEALAYVKTRIAEMEMATNKPFKLLLKETVRDLIRYSNCMWVKSRDKLKSAGSVRKDIRGVELEPVAGYHILPFETLQFKTRSNGDLKKVKQVTPDGVQKEFFPTDVIHFYSNRNPGFSVGTPELLPALDDIALLRRIEENVEELIETNLFPVFHYKIGNDQFPERYGPDGRKETEIVKRSIEYMPSGGVYVSDHRHEIQAIGSESKALRIDFYLTYFKSRVFSAIGVSGVDMGEGASANRSTASTMSKAMMMDVEALQILVKTFMEFYVINELLLEGGYNPLDEDQQVHVKFGVIDKEERLALENNQIQLFANKLTTQTETRKALGMRPLEEVDQDDTYFKLYEEPLALLRGMAPGSAAGDTLADVPTSNVQTKALNKEKAFAKEMEKQKKQGQQGRPANASSTGSKRASAAKAKPSNQSGTRSGAKLNRDVSLTAGGETIIITIDDGDISADSIDRWTSLVVNRYNELASFGVSFDTVVDNLLPRLYRMYEESNE
jgi:hypothetical protein